MIDFQLFRVKAFPSAQGQLFEKNKAPQEILKEIILSNPSVELRKSLVWHIGNVTTIDNWGLYFRIGRTSKSTVALYENGSFIDQQFEIAPYTHVIMDVEIEVCAIAKQYKLATTADGIANQFIRLLHDSDQNRKIDASFMINDLKDPTDFIEYLRKAANISKFWITFTRPNPIDADDLFVKPFQKFLKETEGEKGKAEIKGQKLKSDVLEPLARSAAATGDDAEAVIQTSPKAKKTKKRLKGNPVILAADHMDDDDQKKGFIQRLRDLYRNIRQETDGKK